MDTPSAAPKNTLNEKGPTLIDRALWEAQIHTPTDATLIEGNFYSGTIANLAPWRLGRAMMVADTSRQKDRPPIFTDPHLQEALQRPNWSDGNPPAAVNNPDFMQHSDVIQFVEERDGITQGKARQLADIVKDNEVNILEGIAIGKKLGYIPAEVTNERVFFALRQTPIVVVDPTMISNRTSGVLLPNGQINIARTTVRDTDEAIDTVTHEAGHQFSGGTYIKDSDGKYRRVRAGFQEKFPRRKVAEGESTRVVHGGLDEAIRQHTTNAILHDYWEAMDPRERKNLGLPDNGVYERYLVLTANFVSKSTNPLTGVPLVRVKTLCRANFEDTAPGANFKERRAFIHQVRAAYESGTLRKLDQLMKLCEAEAGTIGMPLEWVDKWAERIHAPIFDRYGQVVLKGWIDTSPFSPNNKEATTSDHSLH